MSNRMKIERKEDLREGDWAKLVVEDAHGKVAFEGRVREGEYGGLFAGPEWLGVRPTAPEVTLVEAYREVPFPTEPGVYVAKDFEDDPGQDRLYQLDSDGEWMSFHWTATYIGGQAREWAEDAHANEGGLVRLVPEGGK
ncbi:hypothetical protein [Microbacterium sp. ZXX196]|uniref:hypothetical protein n=1 Tax=Microbacterium sp. ZXX196 TaxID=2609291 RepID=UPI0012B6D092|nr:hypothetical protein [Microbacterium sp. ZXX196]MTE24852.1 hypothetical protein [Microbacterium sp. ZXX196]